MPSIKEIFDTMEYSPAPESDSAAQQWLEEHGRKFELFIDNKWQESSVVFSSREA